MIDVAGDPVTWAADCYRYLLSQKGIDETTFTFYNDIFAGNPQYSYFVKKMEIKTPTADELKKAADSATPINVGQLTVEIPALGARYAAISPNSDLVKALPEGSAMTVTVDGATVDYCLYVIRNTKVEIMNGGTGGILIADLKKELKDGTQFLLLVTSLESSSQKSVTVTAALQTAKVPTLDELVGSYEVTVTMTDMQVEQAVFDILEQAAVQGDPYARDYAQNLKTSMTQIGSSEKGSFDIRKTGDNTGEIVGGGRSLKFTYENGVLTINHEIKQANGFVEESTKGTLTAAFDQNKKVTVSGSHTKVYNCYYTTEYIYFPENSLRSVFKLDFKRT